MEEYKGAGLSKCTIYTTVLKREKYVHPDFFLPLCPCPREAVQGGVLSGPEHAHSPSQPASSYTNQCMYNHGHCTTLLIDQYLFMGFRKKQNIPK